MTAKKQNELLIDTTQVGIRIIRLNRPEKRNAISTDLLREIAEALCAFDNDTDVRAIVVTGSEKVFAAGADINEIRNRGAIDGLADPRPELWQRIRSTRKPLIAAVEGWCLGAGNELAMCADMIIAGNSAKFGQPETNLGLIPGAGGGAVLSRRIGRARAMEMVLLGKMITADDALHFGLVNRITEDGAALGLATEWAAEIANRAPIALQQAKAVINYGSQSTLDAHLAMERQAFSLVLSSEDKTIGIDAFLKKEKPNWRGR